MVFGLSIEKMFSHHMTVSQSVCNRTFVFQCPAFCIPAEMVFEGINKNERFLRFVFLQAWLEEPKQMFYVCQFITKRSNTFIPLHFAYSLNTITEHYFCLIL